MAPVSFSISVIGSHRHRKLETRCEDRNAIFANDAAASAMRLEQRFEILPVLPGDLRDLFRHALGQDAVGS
jgi:hypothetical protein